MIKEAKTSILDSFLDKHFSLYQEEKPKTNKFKNHVDNVADVLTADPAPGNPFIIDILDAPFNTGGNIARLAASGTAYGLTRNYLKNGRILPSISGILGKSDRVDGAVDYFTEAISPSMKGSNPIVQIQETKRLIDKLDHKGSEQLRKELFSKVIFDNSKNGISLKYKKNFLRAVHDNHGSLLGDPLKTKVESYFINPKAQNINELVEEVYAKVAHDPHGASINKLPAGIVDDFYKKFSSDIKNIINGTEGAEEIYKNFYYDPKDHLDLRGGKKKLHKLIEYAHTAGKNLGLDDASKITAHATPIGRSKESIKYFIKGLIKRPIYLNDTRKLGMLTSKAFNNLAPNRSVYFINRLGKWGAIGSIAAPIVAMTYKKFTKDK